MTRRFFLLEDPSRKNLLTSLKSTDLLPSQGSSAAAFSLLELLFTLTLFGVLLLGLFNFFSQTYQLERDSQSALHSIFIAEGILAILKATAPHPTLPINLEWQPRTLSSPCTEYLAYDEKDQVRHTITLKEYQEPFHEEGITSLVDIEMTSSTEKKGLCKATVTVATPATLADRNRKHIVFSILLPHQEENETILE